MKVLAEGASGYLSAQVVAGSGIAVGVDGNGKLAISVAGPVGEEQPGQSGIVSKLFMSRSLQPQAPTNLAQTYAGVQFDVLTTQTFPFQRYSFSDFSGIASHGAMWAYPWLGADGGGHFPKWVSAARAHGLLWGGTWGKLRDCPHLELRGWK